MTGPARRLLVAVLAVAAALPTAAPVAATALPYDHPVEAAGSRLVLPSATSPIVPGTVHRTSVRLEATYQAYLKLAWSTRAVWVDVSATIRNTSGDAIDRIELNTVAARLGRMRLRPVTVDGRTVAATVSDQTIVVPLGGVLPAGATTVVRVSYGATLRSTTSGSDWMFTRANGVADLYRWLPWVSRATPFARPNHGDPFVTPTSPSVRVRIVTDRPLVLATSGDRVSISADGRTQVFTASNVRDFTVTAAPDFKTGSRRVGGTTVRVYYRAGAPGAAMLAAGADAFAALSWRLGAYPHPTFKVVQSAGGYGMESPGLVWIPTGVATGNVRYLVAHETAHQWFYGIVGNDQARQPFADEAAADFAARYVLSLRRSSRCTTDRLDRTIYAYSARCYYEVIYIQGGGLLDEARRRMGSDLFWSALHRYVADNRDQLATTRTLLDALDDATPLDLGATLFARRFPSLY